MEFDIFVLLLLFSLGGSGNRLGLVLWFLFAFALPRDGRLTRACSFIYFGGKHRRRHR